MRRTACALAALFALGAPAAPAPIVAADSADMALRLDPAPWGGAPLTVMTYNVHGLPWPVIADRGAALDAIGTRLAALRARGAAPHVVVLQEAFSSAARRIGARSGYRYVLDGPGTDAVSPFPETPLPQRYRRRGEGLGAWLTSGLVLLSDYPVVASWQAVFPRSDCAGYDCLANKGVMLARISVPGLALPVDLVTAHVNSRTATHTPLDHADAAYQRQLVLVARFVRDHSDPRLPLIFAGDLNLDSVDLRIAALEGARAGWVAARGDSQGGAVVAICGRRVGPCHLGLGFGSIETGQRNNDWQIFAGGRDVAIRATQARLHFRPDGAGRMLSDHQALIVDYRLALRGGG